MNDNKIKLEDIVPDYVMREPCECLLGQKDLKKTIRFCFLDGTYVEYSLEKNDGTLQDFVNKVQQVHELEKETERLWKQLDEANELLKSLPPLDRWKDDAAVLNYLDKWGVK